MSAILGPIIDEDFYNNRSQQLQFMTSVKDNVLTFKEQLVETENTIPPALFSSFKNAINTFIFELGGALDDTKLTLKAFDDTMRSYAEHLLHPNPADLLYVPFVDKFKKSFTNDAYEVVKTLIKFYNLASRLIISKLNYEKMSQINKDYVDLKMMGNAFYDPRSNTTEYKNLSTIRFIIDALSDLSSNDYADVDHPFIVNFNKDHLLPLEDMISYIQNHSYKLVISHFVEPILNYEPESEDEDEDEAVRLRRERNQRLQITRQQSKIVQLQRRLQAAKAQLAAAQNAGNIDQQQIADLQQEVADLQQQLQDAQDASLLGQQQLQDAQDAGADLQQQLQDAQDQLQISQQQLQDSQDAGLLSQQQIQYAQQQIINLQQLIADLQQQIVDLRPPTPPPLSPVVAGPSQDDFDEVVRQNQSLASDLAEETRQNRLLTGNLDEAARQNQILDDNLTHLKKVLNDMLSSHQKQLDGVLKDWGDSETKYKAIIDNLVKEKDLVERVSSDKQDSLNTLSAQFKREMKALEKQVSDLTKENKALTREISDIQQSLTDYNRTISERDRELSSKDSELARLSALVDDLKYRLGASAQSSASPKKVDPEYLRQKKGIDDEMKYNSDEIRKINKEYPAFSPKGRTPDGQRESLRAATLGDRNSKLSKLSHELDRKYGII